MNNEEKILAILEKHGEMLAQMQTDIFGLKDGQAQMQDDISGLKAGQVQMQDDISGLKAGQVQMQDDITGIKARLDYDVDARLKAMNENIDTILEKLTPKSRMDALEDEMVFMKSVIKAMSQRISDLEKAQ